MKNFLVILLVCLMTSASAIADEVASVSASELNAADYSEWLILDVRSAEEFADGHVPGAMNIGHTELAGRLADIREYQNKPVVVYCRSGYRAAKAADILSEANFSDVLHLEGDIMAWKESNLPLEKPDVKP
ncbi:rhodanese-like domain-containing protein [Alteromonas oceanisediminis]|uniref:rhodanese-like domain-containing protein n=1 Tax=Alteromonas oceanisediminis TaxID=2836180 RepID=UPI001BD94870|nr:rhodanese-like domain-containing protein [Alteromonas oceanisediminis]MBT0585238.1 rhodanese-like domain-containing protein [Alteromonas oceanisediminis]